jgi:hypothetical protein
VDVDKVILEHAPPNERLYVNPAFWPAGYGRFDIDPRELGAHAMPGNQRG